MSGWTDNDRPPAPQGATGSAREVRGIVPRGEKGAGRDALPLGAFFCALGGAVTSSSLAFVGCALVAYGYLSVAFRGAAARVVCLAAALVPALALTIGAGVPAMVSAGVACLAALAVGELTLGRRLTAGALCAVVGVSALALLGADELAARMSGSTLSLEVGSILDYYFNGIVGLTGPAAAQLQAARDVIGLLWPVSYVVAAAASCVAAIVGALLASHGSERAPRPARLTDFDLPLWVVAVFVASIAGLAFAITVDGAASRVALAVSANVAMAVRLALAVQGLAVLAWFVHGRGVGTVGTTLIGAVALYLEVQFVVLTIAGLIDVWANLRHLSRGGRPGATGASMQD